MNPSVRIEDSTEISEEIPPAGQARRGEHLVLELPLKTTGGTSEEFISINMPLGPCPNPERSNFPQTNSPSYPIINVSPDTSLSKAKLYVKNLLPKLSFRYRNSTSEIEKAAILALGASSTGMPEKTLIRSFSLTKPFSPERKGAFSLPNTPISQSNPESMCGANEMLNYVRGGAQLPFHRSNSVPAIRKEGSIRMKSLGLVFRLIPNIPHVPGEIVRISDIVGVDGTKDDGEDASEEEAVCRICFILLDEGSADTLKMECSCKGELALAHQECAVKWFSVKGNITCDICKQDIQNLPVGLLRKPNGKCENGAVQADVPQNRFCQDAPVLVIISMLAYFCFLEQLLIVGMGSSALTISLPLSIVFGILASMTSTTLVRRSVYIWAYATTQFLLTVLFAYIFYTMLRFQAVLSVVLSSFVGFGITLAGKYLIEFVSKWISLSFSNSQHLSPSETDQAQQPGTAHNHSVHPNSRENELQELPSTGV